MFRPSEFRDLISGRRSGAAAALLRAGLRWAEVPYTLAVRIRNGLYDAQVARVHQIPVPVVSVGNLTLGGTGKTPMVDWLARWFQQHGSTVAVISRGYGAKGGQQNDEAMELQQRLPNVPHLQSPDRVGAARSVIERTGCQVIVLDDGFQHRRIGRDLDVVMLDALEPFGFGHVFPRGTLREPISGLRRAQVVVLSRADMLPLPERGQIQQEVRRHAPHAVWAETVHAPHTLRSFSGAEAPVSSLAGQPVAAFCGLGNPAGFRHTLAACGYRVLDSREFADHYRYAQIDIDSLAGWAGSLDVTAVLCTQKDLVKLGIDRLGRLPLWAVGVELAFLAGRADFEEKLRRLLPCRQTTQPGDRT